MGTSGYVGYNSEKAFIASAYLSVLLNLKHFSEVELITDQKGYDLLVKKWNVPFTNVVVCLDKMNHVQSRHWNMAKLEACSMQSSPFMHQDLDVFWFNRPDKRILNAQMCAQDVESSAVDIEFYSPHLSHAKKYFLDIPKYINTSDARATNCGIIGFNDLSIVPIWVEDAWKYINYYEQHTLDCAHPDLGGVVAEQMTIYHLANHLGFTVEYVIESLEEKYKSNKSGFVHLIADTKRNPKSEQMVMNRLALISPSAFKKIVFG
jgi:hypothetical protein